MVIGTSIIFFISHTVHSFTLIVFIFMSGSNLVEYVSFLNHFLIGIFIAFIVLIFYFTNNFFKRIFDEMFFIGYLRKKLFGFI